MGNFSDYFEIRPSDVTIIPSVDADCLNILNQLACLPHEVSGRIGTYKAQFMRDGRNNVDTLTGTSLTFDFSCDHAEPLLLHDQSSGGSASQSLIRDLWFSPSVAEAIQNAMRDIKPGYVAIHIRHTDYQTDYRAFIESIANDLIGKRVLICTDNPEVRSFVVESLPQSEPFFVTEIVETGGKPLHVSRYITSDDDRRRSAINSLIDLAALGMADSVLYTGVTRGCVSGYSRLASFLCKNKDVLENLLHYARMPADELE
ncbi:hypothetical protein DLM45_00195 [Hyphomicrobium methylovorum]|nr:hypothetical protein [Hyphomicrobium methylovorum]